MLQLSQSAAEALDQARDEQGVPDDYGIRVSAVPGPEGQTGLAVDFAEEPDEGDEVSEQAGTQVFISEEVAGPLSESVIDIQETGEGAQLVVRPQEG